VYHLHLLLLPARLVTQGPPSHHLRTPAARLFQASYTPLTPAPPSHTLAASRTSLACLMHLSHATCTCTPLTALASLAYASCPPLTRLFNASHTPKIPPAVCGESPRPLCRFVPLCPAQPRKDQRMWWSEGGAVVVEQMHQKCHPGVFS
jgi:hypothetical protein